MIDLVIDFLRKVVITFREVPKKLQIGKNMREEYCPPIKMERNMPSVSSRVLLKELNSDSRDAFVTLSNI